MARGVKGARRGDGLLSVVVIARDEADRLGRCLASVAWADEVLVLDSGSRDGTPRIARERGARVVHTDWPGFVAQRNRGLARARHPWVLSLDADEWVEDDGAASIRAFLAAPDAEGARIPRRTVWLGHPLRHGRAYPDRQLRLMRRDRARWEGGRVHERAVVDGRVRTLSGHLGHEPYRNLGDHLRTLGAYSELAARDLWDQGRRVRGPELVLRPSLRFVDAYLLRAGFLDGGAGLAVAGLGALYTGSKWGRLWRRQRSASASS